MAFSTTLTSIQLSNAAAEHMAPIYKTMAETVIVNKDSLTPIKYAELLT